MTRVVYTTGPEGGRTPAPCARCRSTPCVCPAVSARPAGDQEVRVRRERAGRGGKTVTVAVPLHLELAEAEALLRELRRACAGGGVLRTVTAPNGTPAYALELQGDHLERLPALLRARGFARAR